MWHGTIRKMSAYKRKYDESLRSYSYNPAARVYL